MIELERWTTKFDIPHRLIIMKDGELAVQVQYTAWVTCTNPAYHYESRKGEK